MRRLWVTALPTLMCLAGLEGLKAAGALPAFIPGPVQVLAEAWAHPWLLWNNLLATAQTATEGFIIAAAVTLVAAGIGTAVRPIGGAVYGLGIVLHAIPVIATAPLLALWLGTDVQMRVVIVVLAAQFPLLAGAMQGLAAADTRQIEMLHCLSANRWQMFRYVQLPSAQPFLFAGFKTATPLAVLGAITAEWAGADRGIGAMMLNALFSYDIATVWLAVLACCALSGLAYAVWSLIERTTQRWNRTVELPS